MSRKAGGGSIVLMLVLGAMLGPAPAGATVKQCGSVVKRIYSNEGFYKAKVLIVHGGQVRCREARQVLWRALQPGGYVGNVLGWECHGFLYSTREKEKCAREGPRGLREVIKSGPAKPCRTCHPNRN